MTARGVLLACVLVLLLATVALGSLVGGFFAGATYTLTREAQTNALVIASALVRLRDGRQEEGIRMLETSLGGDFVSHWGGFPYEDSAPEVWVFRRLPLSGLAFAASYLAEHPDPNRTEFVQEIVACFLRPDLPDPREQMDAHRAAIRSCYEKLR